MKPKPTPQQKFSLDLATVRQPKRICTESWWARPWPDHAAFHAVWTQQLTRWGWTSSDAHLWRRKREERVDLKREPEPGRVPPGGSEAIAHERAISFESQQN